MRVALAAAAVCLAVPAAAWAQAAPPAAPTTEELAARAEALEAQVKALQAEIDELKGQMVRNAPAPAAGTTSKGVPQQEDKKAGLSFKPKGFVQFDAGYVSTPGPERSGVVGGLDYADLGWNSRARRIVIGAEGALGGGFGYNVELNFAQGIVDYEDILLTWQAKGSPLQIRLGNMYPLSSLETMTSSRLTSFMERAAFTDAFGYSRRLGAAVALLDPKDDRYTLTAGLFGQGINDARFNRTGWQASLRGTLAPKLGDARLHAGASFQHRVAPRDAQNIRYRAHPFTQVTDQRFVDSGPIAADGDDVAGLELGAIAGPLHLAAEAQQAWVRGYRAGKAFGPNDGAGGGLFYGGNPAFRSAYVEVGYYLTGESRGYKNGRWDRPKVLRPMGDGGFGALQVNARLDWLDLSDRVGGGAALGPPDFVNGGRQLGYQLSLIWNPIDYVRFQAQYSRAAFAGGPRAATVAPGSSAPLDERSFDVDGVALRAQVEF